MLNLVITAGAAASILGALYNFVLLPLRGVFGGPFEDFNAYSQAAHNVAAGLSPYAGFDPSSIVMSGFDYPPFAAVLLRPLAALSAHSQRVLWMWLAVAALVAGAVIMARALLPATWPRSRIGVLAALTFPPATYNLWLGQMNTLIFLLVAIALSDYLAGRRTRCGMVLGFAAGIKLAPIVLLVVLARRGWWRGVAAGLGAAALTVALGIAALGWSVTHEFLARVLPSLSRDNGWIYNQTWNGVVNRLAVHSVLSPGQPLGWSRLVTIAVSLVTVAAVLLAVGRDRRTRAERGVEFACGVVAMLVIGTMNWYSVYVNLLIPIAAVFALAYERRRQGRVLAGWALAALVVVGGVSAAAIAAMTMQGIVSLSQGALWWLFLQACSLPTLLTAGLLIVMMRELRSGRRPAASIRVAAPAR